MGWGSGIGSEYETGRVGAGACPKSVRSGYVERNAVGQLHAEMHAWGSRIMTQADKAKVPAGSALAVDRDVFSQGVTRALAEHPNVDIVRERIDALPHTGMTIVATGPLTAKIGRAHV